MKTKIKELWKDVVGYEGIYKISSNGVVKNIIKNSILKPSIDSNGYFSVSLSRDKFRKSKRIHKLMADAFLGNPHLSTDHINDVKTDNRLCNLQKITHRANTVKSVKNMFGFVGVVFNKNRLNYRARIRINGKPTFLGSFTTPELAHEAYKKAYILLAL